MAAHNVSLEAHRYVWVRPGFVAPGVPETSPAPLLPAVWFGVASVAGEALGCHVLLESGAVVHDLPLHALSSRPDPTARLSLLETVGWDCFGDACEVVTYDYLDGRRCEVLDRQHRPLELRGLGWFAVDWVGDGYSLEPCQRKQLHVIALEQGPLMAVPQDRILWHDPSFTVGRGVPVIRRQDRRWAVEPLLLALRGDAPIAPDEGAGDQEAGGE